MGLRIKKKEELERDFGSDWRERVLCLWTPGMDELFGRVLSDKQEEEVEEFSPEYDSINIDGFNISTDMITEDEDDDDEEVVEKDSSTDDDESDEEESDEEEYCDCAPSLTAEEIDMRVRDVAEGIEKKFVGRVDEYLETMFKDYEDQYVGQIDRRVESAMRDYVNRQKNPCAGIGNLLQGDIDDLKHRLLKFASHRNYVMSEINDMIVEYGYEPELNHLCAEYYGVSDYKSKSLDSRIASVIFEMREKSLREQQDDEEFFNVIKGEDKMTEGKATTVDTALQFGKKIWKKNAALNISAAKNAAKRKVGQIVNNKLVDMILKNVPMPRWIAVIGGKKILRPLVKLLVSNSGVVSMGFLELQGYKSSKAEFVSEAMMLDGYDSLADLINTENISAIVDKIIDAVPDTLLTDAGFNKSKSKSEDE